MTEPIGSLTIAELVRIVIENELCAPRTAAPDHARLDELGGDSLDRVSMIFDLERRFEIHISVEEEAALQTVADVITLVQRKVAA